MSTFARERTVWLTALALCVSASAAYGDPAGDALEEKEAARNGAAECRRAKTLAELLCGPRVRSDEDADEPEEEEPLASDRPDFVEASSNVGRGRIQLEAGYTYVQDRDGGATTRQHSVPEVLLRIGLFADWFELRVGQNYRNETTSGNGRRTNDGGAEDLYLGIGLALFEQKGLLPECRVVFQTRVPSGADPFTIEEAGPGINILYGWDVIKDRLSLGMSTACNRARDDGGDFYYEIAQGVTTGITLTEKLSMYVEWFGLMPAGATAPGTWPEYYLDSGFTYRFTNNLQFDVRVGVGLNRRADDFFAGTGFAVRF